MRGLMQDWPLLCHRIIEHAALFHGTPTDSSITAVVTIAAPVRPQGHLRAALSALNFMSIP